MSLVDLWVLLAFTPFVSLAVTMCLGNQNHFLYQSCLASTTSWYSWSQPLPNAFSPDGNGWNERFNTVSPCAFTKYNLKIFSRWGELLFETSDPSFDAGWNGTFNGQALQSDDYWFIATLADGRTFSGHFTLKR